jgi:hypothetical protein
MIRSILQLRTYLGYVKYQKYARHSNGRRSWENPVEWFDGYMKRLLMRLYLSDTRKFDKHE